MLRKILTLTLFLFILFNQHLFAAEYPSAELSNNLSDILGNSIGFSGHLEENVVDVYDKDGNLIFSTAMGVVPEDRYISEDNTEYVVEEVNEGRAVARSKGKIKLLTEDEILPVRIPLAADDKKTIGLYNTHNDESYRPGPTNVNGQGEIHTVARSLKTALEKKGIKVILSNNIHLPHDGAAYERSRATAVDLVKEGADAIFDVHRDAVPSKKYYLKKVNGEEISQIRIVVGRQNPNIKMNDYFARSLKSVADKEYPGLIKGIFYGRGNYNQQMSTRALLLEFGTHVTTEGEAELSAAMLADSINLLLYGGKGVKPFVETQGNSTGSILSTVAWIIGIVLLVGLGFLFINEGNWQGVKERLRGFISREVLDRENKK